MIKFFTHTEHKNFRRLWAAQLVSQIGDRINQMALIGLMASRAPGSAMALAKMLSFTIIPALIIQPIAGVLIDRWDRRTTLFVCDLARGVLTLMIPFVFIYRDSLVPIYICVFLIFSFSRFHVPAKMAFIPDLVKEQSLLAANSLITITSMLAFAVGMAFGGFLVDLAGPRDGFIWDAVTFFISGWLVYSIDPFKIHINRKKIFEESKAAVSRVKKTIVEELKEGFVYLIGHKEIRFVISMCFVLLAAAGAVQVIIIVFIQESFGNVTKDLGVLGVSLCAGLLFGSVVYSKLGKHVSWVKTLSVSLFFGGVMLGVFALTVARYADLYLALGLAFLLGLIIGPMFIAANTIIHKVCEESMRGKVFSALEIVIHFAYLMAMFVSSWASQFVSKAVILAVVGLVFSVVGLVSFRNADKLEINQQCDSTV